jgi:hypothetical protein
METLCFLGVVALIIFCVVTWKDEGGPPYAW